VPAPGDPAPAIVLVDQHGDTFDLSSLRGRNVVVYFYPKADTPGCTQQACGLRDIGHQIGDTAIVGISPDAPAKLARFDTKHHLGFVLLSDPDHAVAEKYDVWVQKSMYGKTYMGVQRSAFLIDEEGIVKYAWPKISPKDTPNAIVAALSP
jgi:peroxiredoxin Q/BCP